MDNNNNIPQNIKAPYFVPEGYFTQLPLLIAESIKAADLQEESIRISSIKSPYSVPDTYFDNLGQSIIEKVKDADKIIHQHIYSFGKVAMLYQVPLGYFMQVADEILDKAREQSAEQETKLISPILASISKEMPFSTATEFVTEKVITENKKDIQLKTVEMPVLRSLRITKWAAAAAVLFIFAWGGFSLLNPINKVKPYSEQSVSSLLAKIPHETIEEYVYAHIDEYETEFDIMITNKNNIYKEELRQIINEIPQEELRDYLEI